MTTAGMLFSEMDPAPEHEGVFDEWYEQTHIPNRLSLPGFGAAFRARRSGAGVRNAVCYLIDDLGVLETEGYRRVKDEPDELTRAVLAAAIGFTRFTGREIWTIGTPGPSTRSALIGRLRVQPESDTLREWAASTGFAWSSLHGLTAASESEVAALFIAGSDLEVDALEGALGTVPMAIAHIGVFEITHWAQSPA
ncbi:MAG: hypothetical protein RLZZ01_903, partial [Actinomycetota bacterium]